MDLARPPTQGETTDTKSPQALLSDTGVCRLNALYMLEGVKTKNDMRCMGLLPRILDANTMSN